MPGYGQAIGSTAGSGRPRRARSRAVDASRCCGVLQSSTSCCARIAGASQSATSSGTRLPPRPSSRTLRESSSANPAQRSRRYAGDTTASVSWLRRTASSITCSVKPGKGSSLDRIARSRGTPSMASNSPLTNGVSSSACTMKTS